MEISDTKLAIAVIGVMVVTLTGVAYMSGVLDSSIIIGIFSTAVAAIAGLAGYDMIKRQTNPPT